MGLMKWSTYFDMFSVGPFVPDTIGRISCGVLWILRRKCSRWVMTSLVSLYRNLYFVSSISPRFFSLAIVWFISWVTAGVGSCGSSWYVLVSDKCWSPFWIYFSRSSTTIQAPLSAFFMTMSSFCLVLFFLVWLDCFWTFWISIVSVLITVELKGEVCCGGLSPVRFC